MTNNHSSHNDKSLPTSISSEKSVPLYLSEIDKNSNEQEIDVLFNELLNNIHPKKLRGSRKISLWSIILPKNLQEGLVFGILFFYLLVSLFVALPVRYQVSIFWARLIVETSVFAIILLLFLSIIVSIKSNWQSPREKTQRCLNKIKNEFIAEQEKVARLYSLASQEKLKSFEIEIEKTIREAQASERIISSASLISAIIIVLLSIYILDIQPQDLGNNLLKNAPVGIPGAVPLIAITLNFMNALNLKSEINELSKCLALLKKAQIKRDKVETYKNLAQSEQSGKKQSLISKLKQIKIDGPEDFAENLDLYLSGEKRVEPDIR